MSWYGKWNGNTAGSWWGRVLSAATRYLPAWPKSLTLHRLAGRKSWLND